MAANNSRAMFSEMSQDDTITNKYAIVPYQPQQQSISSLEGEILAPMPLSCLMPADQQEKMYAATGKRSQRASLQKSSQISMSPLFAFTLPQIRLQYMSSLEPVMKEHKGSIHCAPQERWFTIAQRLQEWRCEKRQRDNGGRVDKYFYHRNMKLRSQQELKFFIKYGFLPCKSQGKRTRQTFEEEAAATRSKGPRYLDEKEKELISTYKIDTHIIEEVDKIVRTQLQWTRPSPVVPPSNDKQLTIYQEGLPKDYTMHDSGVDQYFLPPPIKEIERKQRQINYCQHSESQ